MRRGAAAVRRAPLGDGGRAGGLTVGRRAAERERILADTAAVEPLLRSSATMEIDIRRPLAEVVDELAALVGPPPSPR